MREAYCDYASSTPHTHGPAAHALAYAVERLARQAASHGAARPAVVGGDSGRQAMATAGWLDTKALSEQEGVKPRGG